MLFSTDLFSILHRIALAAFLVVTSVSMLIGVLGRLRLRHPRFIWHRSGLFIRLVLGPLLFLLVVGAGVGHAWMTGRSVPLFVLMGYPTGGVIWILAAWINESVVVTECGIVSDLRRTNRAVVWSQITDYFTKKTEGRAHFVFFYQGDEGTRRRVDLPVPDQEADLFHQFVKRKLDARFRVSVDDVSDPGEIPKPDDRVDLS